MSLTCAEAEPLLPLVADGAVDPDSDPELFAHLAACPACQRVVADHDLISLALARPSPAPQRRRWNVIRLWPLAAAACLALAATAWWAASRTPDAAPAPLVTDAIPVVPAPAGAATTRTGTAAAPMVVRVPRADGSTLYLVQRDGAWIEVDPAAFDGQAQAPVHDGAAPAGAGAGVQVRN